MLVTPYHDRWEANMTDARPFTVVCVADDSRSTKRVDLVENTFVAFVMADNVSEAMRTGQVQAAESGLGPNEPIDWAVVFMAEGHHRNVNDDPD
jgi:hypothetical protein